MSQTCDKCGRLLNDTEFYTTKRLDKYPTGKLNTCKKDITLMVDNWDPETFKWILEECDVPYVKEVWDAQLDKALQSNKKVTSMSVLGKYLSQMKLIQWKKYHYSDTEKIAEEMLAKKQEAMKKQGLSDEEIAATLSIPKTPEKPKTMVAEEGTPQFSIEDTYNEEDRTILDSLSDEDKLMLRLKWGREYRPEEWVRMEQLYDDMVTSYDVQGAGHKDTLIMICKASLKANQLIDANDIEGFQKMSKVYDSLMKSGNFTAAQNKQDKGDYVDSLGELFALCETQGFIPRYYIEQPNDKVDETLLDTKRYLSTLVENETNLTALVEEAIKANMKEDEAAKNADDDDSGIFDDIAAVEQELSEEDYEEFSNFEDAERDLAAALENEEEDE